MIRRASAADAAAIALLFRRSYGTLTFLPTLHTPDEDRAYFAGVVRDRDVWVYETEGRILAFAAFAGGVLSDLWVEPEDQGRGVGSELLEHVQREHPEGFGLWVFQRNERARRFYERRGCRLVELTDGSGNEEREPDARYAWP